ncbi:MAG: hypothetical protein KF799_01880 [Bdellovibrionales bacterium]|nr:hypothetical protein [Bdellovibrionales bacterium]
MSTRRWLIFSVLLLVAAALVAAALTPSVREGVQSYFGQVGREVLATADGDLLNEGTPAKVIKYRNRDGLFVDVLRVTPDGGSSLVDRILLPDKHDGLFNFHGRVTRLAIADVDGDGKMELLAPSFDNQLVPHLNVFRYNPAIQRFEAAQPPDKVQ